MSRREKKPKLTLRPDALAWLAKRCSPQEWQRSLDLYDRQQIPALLTYLQSLMPSEVFSEFEEKNLEPSVLAERRKAEAERIQAEENEARTIRQGNIPAPTAKDILNPPGWHPLRPSKEEQEALKRTVGDLYTPEEAEF